MIALGTCTLLLQTACTPKSASKRNAAAVDSLQAELASCKAQGRELDEKNAALVKLTSQLQKDEETNRALQAELDLTREVLEYAERQFISLEKGLQSHETKASAVAALAEARLAYDKIVRTDPKAAQQNHIRDALEKIEKSDEMVLKQRYAASVYFARRAMRLIEERPQSGGIRVISVDQANVRKGPGMQYDVIAMVDIGTILVEIEHQSPWLRVETKGGLEGWVHESVTALR